MKANLALRQFAQQSGTPLLIPNERIREVDANALIGSYSKLQALDILLKNTRVVGQINQHGVLTVNLVESEDTIKDKSMELRKKPLAQIISVMAAFFGGAPVSHAQTDAAADGALEEIVVTGIRQSLKRSLETKRDASSIVDAINAEDIGKFPDTNVAESLQRISGVSISRESGEGKFISIRGLGPAFSPVTINGRTLTSGFTGTPSSINLFQGSGREFAFNVLPSELIAGLEVYKTPTADLVEGGVGGLVEVKTRRPLDFDDTTLAASLKGTYDEGSETTEPTGSVMYADQFADETVGVLLNGTYAKRSTTSDRYWGWGWEQGGVHDLSQPTTVDPDTGNVSNTSNPEGWYPFEDVYNNVTDSSERYGINGSLQFRPTDELEIVVDGLFTNTDAERVDYAQAVRWTAGGLTPQGNPQPALGVDVNGNPITARNRKPFRLFDSIVDANGKLISGNTGTSGVQVAPKTELTFTTTDTLALGTNATWESDQWTISGDVSYSKAESDFELKAANFIGYAPVSYTANGSAPAVYTSSANLADPTLYHFKSLDLRRLRVEDDELAFKLDADYQLDMDFVTSLEFGVRVAERNKTSNNERVDDAHSGGTGIYLNSGDLTLADFLTTTSGGSGSVISNDGSAGNFLVPVAQNVFDHFDAANATYVQRQNEFFDISEETRAAYVRLNFDQEFGDMALSGNVGVRYITTDITATGASPTSFTADRANGTVETVGDFRTVDTNYSHTLPSLNLRLDLTEELALRFGAARTLTRPNLSAMAPRAKISAGGGNVSVNVGNPDLKPFESDGYDLSLEYYFSDAGLLSGAVFYKDVGGFVFNNTLQNQQFLGQTVEFLTIAENAASAKIKGYEIGYQQAFDFLPGFWGGFGMLANYTYIDSSTEFNNGQANAGQSFAFEGLSEDTYNLTGYYEADGLSVRLSYNYRSEFLEFGKFLFSSRTIDAYGQLDLSASYDVNEDVSLTFDAVNLTDDEVRSYDGGFDDFTSVSYHNGRRFTLGVRAKF
ncbi:TonB-dependent receptor [Pseudoteredinibacter isoporae]|nr:TonB-dependent receptor [Pseudoteredinibacter isoporae]